MRELTISEEMVLTTIWRLRNNAYGVTIRTKINDVIQRDMAYGTLYNLLAQLVRKGYVVKNQGLPTAERGGRSKIYYSLSEKGLLALKEAHKLQQLIWNDLPDLAK